MQKNEHTYWSRAAMGLVVIVVGVVFLLRNFGISLPFMQLHNWWAFFILVGAVPSLALAFQRYKSVGRADARVLHNLLSALAVIMVAMFFLLELSWELWWPLFVVYGGLWMLVKGSGDRPDSGQA